MLGFVVVLCKTQTQDRKSNYYDFSNNNFARVHGNTIEVMLLCIGIEVSLQEIEVLYMSCTCSYNFTDGWCYHTSKNLHANHQQSTCYPPHTHWLVFLLSLCSSCSPLDDGNTASQPFLACLSWECCCPSVGTVGYKHNNRRRRRRRRRWRRLRKEKKKEKQKDNKNEG